MRKEGLNKIFYLILNSIFSIILANLGIVVFSDNKAIGIITIMISFILLYFSFYTFQINKNKEKVESIENDLKLLKQSQEISWKILNSLSDNKLIEKINKITKMNKKGASDIDLIEILKIVILLIVGYIIIKALLSVA